MQVRATTKKAVSREQQYAHRAMRETNAELHDLARTSSKRVRSSDCLCQFDNIQLREGQDNKLIPRECKVRQRNDRPPIRTQQRPTVYDTNDPPFFIPHHDALALTSPDPPRIVEVHSVNAASSCEPEEPLVDRAAFFVKVVQPEGGRGEVGCAASISQSVGGLADVELRHLLVYAYAIAAEDVSAADDGKQQTGLGIPSPDCVGNVWGWAVGIAEILESSQKNRQKEPK